jgi:hypothetical protein
MRLTAEQQKVLLAKYSICVNEACDRRHKILPEVRWTRKDMPETYRSRTWAAGRGKQTGGEGLHLAFVKGKTRWTNCTS